MKKIYSDLFFMLECLVEFVKWVRGGGFWEISVDYG